MLEHERIAQATLAEGFGISEPALDKTYKEIVKSVGRINPETPS